MRPDELATLVADIVEERWQVTETTATAVGKLSVEVGRLVAAELILDFLGRIRGTRSGTALLLAMGDPEPIREAAKRLSCSAGTLATLVQQYRVALGDHENGGPTLQP